MRIRANDRQTRADQKVQPLLQVPYRKRRLGRVPVDQPFPPKFQRFRCRVSLDTEQLFPSPDRLLGGLGHKLIIKQRFDSLLGRYDLLRSRVG
ncbi:hypothetical protein D3C74_450120 [compost metagenome]